MITGTLFAKQTNTHGNIVQKPQYQVCSCINLEITNMEGSYIQKTAPEHVRSRPTSMLTLEN